MTTATAVRHSITVAAPRERAFTTFTQGMSTWWPRTHKIGQAELAEAVIEGRLEVSFVSEGPDRTRVELEHRGLDAYGERAAEMRETFDGPNAWRGILEEFARAV